MIERVEHGDAVLARGLGWRWVALFLCLDLIKQGVLLAAGVVQPWGDSVPYWELAQRVAAGDFWLLTSPIASRTPGYLWYLAACQFVAGSYALVLALIGQHLAVVATSVVTVASVWELTHSRRAQCITWTICLLATARPLHANWLLTESLATFLLTLAVWCLLRAMQDRPAQWLIAASVISAVGVLLRPALVVLMPVLFGVAIWLGRNSSMTLRRRLCLVLGTPLIVGSLLLPWCLRNQVLFGRLTLCEFTGRELWTSQFSPWPGGELDWPETQAAAEATRFVDLSNIDWRHQWMVSDRLTQAGLNDAEADRLMQRVAWDAVRRQPWQAFVRTVARCLTFWYCWEWETDLRSSAEPPGWAEQTTGQVRWSLPGWQYRLMQFLRCTPERAPLLSNVWSIAAGCGAIGLLVRRPLRPAGLILGGLLLGTTVLTAVLEIPLYRYRMPLEPLMLICMIAGLFRWPRATD